MVQFRDRLAHGYAAHPPWATLTRAEARAVAEEVRAPWAAGGPAMRQTAERVVSRDGLSVRARVHVPTDAPDGVLVYVHGGGWTIFSIDTHDRVMREYAARANAVVVGIDYSLVPEAHFPTPVHEVVALLRALRDPAGGLGEAAGLVTLHEMPLAIGGDSAGGNLALAASLALRDAGEDGVVQAILVNYGALDAGQDRFSYRLHDGPEFNLTAAEMRGFWEGYVPDPAQRTDPRASPLRADLRGLPPTFVAVAECDVLASENLALAVALRDAGVQARAVVYPGMLHSFLEAVSISDTASRAFDDGAAWLQAAFGRRGFPMS